MVARWRRLREWRGGDKMAGVGDAGGGGDGGVAAQERKDAKMEASGTKSAANFPFVNILSHF